MAIGNPAKFIQEVRAEASKITWPTRRETVQTSIMVLIMAFLTAMFFLAVDQVLSFLIRQVVAIGS